MKYELVLTNTAIKDIERHKKSGNKAILNKLHRLLQELMNHPKTGSGNPEILKYNLQGLYSRRIDKKHRLVYSIEEEAVTVFVLSAHSHYKE